MNFLRIEKIMYQSINDDHVILINTLNISQLRKETLPEKLNRDTVKEINRRIFAGVEVADYTPGTFRNAAEPGSFNLSSRNLKSQNDRQIFSMRSFMDESALKRFDFTLGTIQPELFKQLNTAEFTQKISEIYANLDYTHPFLDGNSRTFRTFTQMAAKSAGFDLNWDRVAESQFLRDELYCARSIEANRLAAADPAQSHVRENVLNMLDDLSDKRDLNQLLSEERIITPYRALAFKHAVQQCFNTAGNDLLQLKNQLLLSCRTLSEQYQEIEAPLRELAKYINTAVKAHNDVHGAQTCIKVLTAFYWDLETGETDFMLKHEEVADGVRFELTEA